MMAWWQKKLLRYALSRTGLLDDQALNLDNLDITLGTRNVIELKDVSLNIKRLTELARLPPAILVETARVVSLRLTVPADIYQSSISVDVNGVNLGLRLVEQVRKEKVEEKDQRRETRETQHRKVHRRLRSPPPYEPGGTEDDGVQPHIPTARELAKSFLLEEPERERRQLEATLAAKGEDLEESFASESSGSQELGTGAAVGVPGFLAGFLQGIVDRLQVSVRNVTATLETELGGEGQDMVAVALELRVGSIVLDKVDSETDGRRRINLNNMTLDLVSHVDVFADLSKPPSRASSVVSPASPRSPVMPNALPTSPEASVLSSRQELSSTQNSQASPASSKSPDVMRASVVTRDSDRFADAGEDDEEMRSVAASKSELEIQPGDDNISWGSRRNQSLAPTEDLWKSMMSDDGLPESLLLERTPTPRLSSSRNNSLVATRSRRNVSPYARTLPSPGSWPTFDDRVEPMSLRQSPGSWPTLHQTEQSIFQPLTPAEERTFDAVVDNKRIAAKGSLLDTETPEEQNEDLAASRLFTHKEAQSMYISAISHGPQMHIPGGWSSAGSNSERSSSPEQGRASLSQPPPLLPSDLRQPQAYDESLAYGDKPYSTPKAPLSGNITPRPRTPVPGTTRSVSLQEGRKVSKQLIHVDAVSLLLPSEAAATETPEQAPPRQMTMSTSYSPHGMPGTFSAYSDMTAPKRKLDASASFSTMEDSSLPARDPGLDSNLEQLAQIGVSVGTVSCQVDLACSRMLYRLAAAVMGIANTAIASPSRDETYPRPARTNPLSVSVSKTLVTFHHLVEELPTNQESSIDEHKGAVAITCEDLEFVQETGEKTLRFGRLEIFVGKSCLLSFDRKLNANLSVPTREKAPDILLTVTHQSTVKRSIIETSIEALPIKLLLDLREIDEAFEGLGGLSGVLDVGNSILSESGLSNVPVSPVKLSKGVHFEGQSEELRMDPETKINLRLKGLSATLQGSHCAIHLQTSTVRAIYREIAAVVTTDHVQLSGPYEDAQQPPPITLSLSSTRIEYLTTPQDKDLERMLSLLTPSKDRYDTDDDILVDILIRQRRKGAVARITIDKVKAKCLDWACLDTMSSLGAEMNKLSAVTKYLPEDDRPGVLTLLRIQDCEARLPVNERFGSLHVSLSDLNCAQVGVPMLLALSIADVRASQSNGTSLVHPLVETTASGGLPMIMFRMLGDIEPLAKVKLLNVAVEYSVPVLLDLTGMDLETGPEKVATDLANSVADLFVSKKSVVDMALVTSPTSHEHSTSLKSTTYQLDLLFHDSALVLSPQHSPNKALLVFADVKFGASLPPKADMVASIELRKAGLFLADVMSRDMKQGIPMRNVPSNTAVKPQLTSALSRQGYVSVGSIMSARIDVRAEDAPAEVTRNIEFDITTQLVLLETCADSTQTLIAVMNGLAPPTPPSKQPKYLTEPMAIEDMMASFTGDAFPKPEPTRQTLFDVEEEAGDEPDAFFNMADFEEDDDGLLAESGMTSSLYGPVGGLIGDNNGSGENEAEADEGSEYFAATAESLLEDDPFEMTITPAEAPMSDAALVRELNKQCKPAADEELIDLGVYESEDLGFDALGGTQNVLGGPNRFNTPATTVKRPLPSTMKQKFPLKLKVRDLHLIWNIYDGYDWQRTREGITNAVEEVEQRAEQRKANRRRSQVQEDDDESVIGDFLFNSIYIGVPSNQDAQDLRRQINRHIDDMASETESVPMSGMSRLSAYSAPGRSRPRRRLKLERSRTHKIAFELKRVSADVLVFPPDSTDVVSSVDVRVDDLEIFDNVPTSTWRKFLTHLDTDPNGREMMKPMIHIELLNVRTLENFAASELALHVTVLPLRLHVDQDALDFITRFFEFKDDAVTPPSAEGEQPFIQRLEVETVDLRLDYKPKKVDYAGIRSGHTNEFMNFIILDSANIRLKHAIIYGIKGFEPLHKTLNDIWMPDVKRNQLPTVLAGLAPVRSLVNIGTGVRDVVAIPIREYKKDGRIVRSIQKGAFHFGKTTASELARLGAKVAIGTQNLLQGAEGLLVPGLSVSPGGNSRPSSALRRSPSDHGGWHDLVDAESSEDSERRAISSYANQPLSVFGGLRSARRYLEHDLLTARDALIAVQGEILESEGPGGAVAAVARHAPTVILRPIIGTTRAVGTVMLGVGNSIDRDGVRRVDDKYKKR